MEHLTGIDYAAMGRRIRQKRRDMGLTQERLAERVCVSPSFIVHIERAEKVPSLDTMARLSITLDTTLDYLVCGVQLRCEREKCHLFHDLGRVLEAYGIREHN